jgi:uncharacterized membrane protein SirB2
MSSAGGMIEFYPQVRQMHIWAVCLSGGFFALRGLGVLAGHGWPRHALVRYASYTIDTVLLTAALMLLTILPGAMFANHWLTVKLCFVVAYIAFGIAMMRTRRGTVARTGFYAAALLAYATAFGIARMHHPAGWLLPLLGWGGR